jgi:hypothetical protein
VTTTWPLLSTSSELKIALAERDDAGCVWKRFRSAGGDDLLAFVNRRARTDGGGADEDAAVRVR